MLKIHSYSDLTNEYIANIDDSLFKLTQAYNAFQNKLIFAEKIIDTHLRFKMMKNILEFKA